MPTSNVDFDAFFSSAPVVGLVSVPVAVSDFASVCVEEVPVVSPPSLAVDHDAVTPRSANHSHCSSLLRGVVDSSQIAAASLALRSPVGIGTSSAVSIEEEEALAGLCEFTHGRTARATDIVPFSMLVSGVQLEASFSSAAIVGLAIGPVLVGHPATVDADPRPVVRSLPPHAGEDSSSPSALPQSSVGSSLLGAIVDRRQTAAFGLTLGLPRIEGETPSMLKHLIAFGFCP